jgi:hypothetical protein
VILFILFKLSLTLYNSEFEIDCVVKNFTTNRMKPFTITSDTSLKELVAVVAEKMDVYAGHLELRYRLVSNDKLSSSTMDVTMEAELKIAL